MPILWLLFLGALELCAANEPFPPVVTPQAQSLLPRAAMQVGTTRSPCEWPRGSGLAGQRSARHVLNAHPRHARRVQPAEEHVLNDACVVWSDLASDWRLDTVSSLPWYNTTGEPKERRA